MPKLKLVADTRVGATPAKHASKIRKRWQRTFIKGQPHGKADGSFLTFFTTRSREMQIESGYLLDWPIVRQPAGTARRAEGVLHLVRLFASGCTGSSSLTLKRKPNPPMCRFSTSIRPAAKFPPHDAH